ncbi:SpoVR family protein [Paenibacillus larvae]|uniref:SpoVR family protein n=1 Tax=Paenibacillus larvae TaxID=1464 RepID=A0AAP5JRS5_9BACL|nr:SpoVR family protein [Paenibacillus larvae]MDT2172795.1 SpoVR family protein [Paenibacillus larvae]MDT2182187.1 SpoVR family protein [Paenibacillus larvae]MDT2198299.1 SpoVR family protein [Paenibacillus larvae]MDT2207772.1 SpoVR family protein [Paenibacillus larvae]MDT2231197.1 SpoVR family protein [Paenibacillus larvae]
MKESEKRQLEYAIAEISEVASGFGLDFYPMRYEICPAEIIYTFGAYGMPTRFSHWSFGNAKHNINENTLNRNRTNLRSCFKFGIFTFAP